MKLPKQAFGEIIYEPVVSHDLFPTILNTLDISYNINNIDGMDLNNIFLKKEFNRDYIFGIFHITMEVYGNQVQQLEIMNGN